MSISYFFINKGHSLNCFETTNVSDILDSLSISTIYVKRIRGVNSEQFVWGARAFLTVLRVNLQNSFSGSKLMSPKKSI